MAGIVKLVRRLKTGFDPQGIKSKKN